MKTSILCFVLLFGLTACNNSSPTSNATTTATSPENQKSVDAQLITDYVKANNLKGERTASGIYFVLEKQGDGPSAKDLTSASKVSAHYHGTFLNGKVFDSSVDRGKPLDFQLRQVIPGWQEAIKMLNVGGKGTFIIPSHMAYSSRGYPGLIEPNTVLRFDIELLEI